MTEKCIFLWISYPEIGMPRQIGSACDIWRKPQARAKFRALTCFKISTFKTLIAFCAQGSKGALFNSKASLFLLIFQSLFSFDFALTKSKSWFGTCLPHLPLLLNPPLPSPHPLNPSKSALALPPPLSCPSFTHLAPSLTLHLSVSGIYFDSKTWVSCSFLPILLFLDLVVLEMIFSLAQCSEVFKPTRLAWISPCPRQTFRALCGNLTYPNPTQLGLSNTFSKTIVFRAMGILAT